MLTHVLFLCCWIAASRASLPFLPNFTVAGVPSATVSFIPDFAHAAAVTRRSARSGRWSTPATWQGNVVPVADDVVLIDSGHNVTYDVLPGNEVDLKRVAVQSGALFVFEINQNTKMLVDTIYVAEGGIMAVGSPEGIVGADYTAEIVFRDAPVDVAEDPYEFGHGLLVLGDLYMVGGRVLVPFVRATDEVDANARVLNIRGGAAAAGWRVGDRLLVPDSRQLNLDQRQTSIDTVDYTQVDAFLEIEAIDGASGEITLAAPGFLYDHPGRRNAAGAWDVNGAGQKEFVPHVANMQRNIIVRSANAQSLATNQVNRRGHCMVTGNGRAYVQGVAFRDLGRTKLTQPVSGVQGTSNMIGRYAFHFHHAIGRPTTDLHMHTFIGNVLERSAKWALAIHNTHYSYFGFNIVFDAGGAGIITEDGNEFENVIEHNFVVGVRGTGARASDSFNGLGAATEGTSFWFHGIFSKYRNNVASTLWTQNPGTEGGEMYSTVCCNGQFGFFYSLLNTEVGSIWAYDMPTPNAKGTRSGWITRDAVIDAPAYFNFDNNEGYGPGYGGLTIWSIGRKDFELASPRPDYFYINDLKFWNFMYDGIFLYQLDRVVFNRYKVRGTVNLGTVYAKSWTGSDYIATDIVALDWDIQGVAVCMPVPDLRGETCFGSTPTTSTCPAPGSAAASQFTVINGTFRCPTLIESSLNWDKNGDYWDKGPQRTVITGGDWQTIAPVCNNCAPSSIVRMEAKCRDSTNLLAPDETIFIDFNGVANDNFQVFYQQQRGNFFWPASLRDSDKCCNKTCTLHQSLGAPSPGRTNDQLLAAGLETVFAGAVAPCSTTRAGFFGRYIGSLTWDPVPVCGIIAQNVRIPQVGPPATQSTTTTPLPTTTTPPLLTSTKPGSPTPPPGDANKSSNVGDGASAGNAMSAMASALIAIGVVALVLCLGAAAVFLALKQKKQKRSGGGGRGSRGAHYSRGGSSRSRPSSLASSGAVGAVGGGGGGGGGARRSLQQSRNTHGGGTLRSSRVGTAPPPHYAALPNPIQQATTLNTMNMAQTNGTFY